MRLFVVIGFAVASVLACLHVDTHEPWATVVQNWIWNRLAEIDDHIVGIAELLQLGNELRLLGIRLNDGELWC